MRLDQFPPTDCTIRRGSAQDKHHLLEAEPRLPSCLGLERPSTGKFKNGSRAVPIETIDADATPCRFGLLVHAHQKPHIQGSER